MNDGLSRPREHSEVPPSFDLLRVFVAVVDAGTFSAAGRVLGRVQSAVSHAVARLEEELGVVLFDRSTRRPTLTAAGEVLVVRAREALDSAQEVSKLARSLAAGTEAEVSIVFDAVFPTEALVALAFAFRQTFPEVSLRIGTETLGAVTAAVERRAYTLGVCGPAAEPADVLDVGHIGTVRMVAVCGAAHALTEHRGPVSRRELQRHTQIVLSERGAESSTEDVAVMSPRTWRVVDLSTKQALLERGLGWGNLPEHMAAPRIAAGALAAVNVAAWGPDEHLLGMRVVRRWSEPLGPAASWVMSLLPDLCAAARSH